MTLSRVQRAAIVEASQPAPDEGVLTGEAARNFLVGQAGAR